MLVSFRIGKYEDEVLCDVTPIDAGHLLLGRPWQFDRRVKHDGYTNKYSQVQNNRNIILVLLAPKQVHEDQVKLQQESVTQRESVQANKNATKKKRWFRRRM